MAKARIAAAAKRMSREPEESRELEQIRKALSQEFAPEGVSVYRYNPASIRVRIVGRRFQGKPIFERLDMVEPLLDCLPESLQADIIFLLTLGPRELKESEANYEFDHPSEPRV